MCCAWWPFSLGCAEKRLQRFAATKCEVFICKVWRPPPRFTFTLHRQRRKQLTWEMSVPTQDAIKYYLTSGGFLKPLTSCMRRTPLSLHCLRIKPCSPLQVAAQPFRGRNFFFILPKCKVQEVIKKNIFRVHRCCRLDWEIFSKNASLRGKRELHWTLKGLL